MDGGLQCRSRASSDGVEVDGVQLLDMMVGTEKEVSVNLVRVLVNTGLLDEEGRMTNKGFQFLLRDTFSQLWALLLSYSSSCESRGMPVADVLSFFFQLGFLTVGNVRNRFITVLPVNISPPEGV